MLLRSLASSRLAACMALSMLVCSPSLYAAGIKIQNANYAKDDGVVIVKGKIEGLGDDVNVLVKNLSTGDVLANVVTDKQFSSEIPVSSFADVPCQIVVQAGSQVATSEVRHGPGDCASYEYTLEGIVTDEPIPYATVSVTLNGVTYTTTADEFGNYELPIISTNLNQLVKIDASAEDPETGDPIEFVNLAGSFSRVLDGNAQGNVTNVTTASYVLAVEANGGDEPTTPEELQAAETAIDATELFELAALIKLIVDDKDYSLPPGETSLVEFISDPVAVETYVATVPQEDLDAALQEILNDSDLVAGFSEGDVPERYYAIPVAAPGYIARSGNAFEFELGTDRGAILGLDGGMAINQGYTWSVDTSGRLVLEFDTPVVIENFPAVGSLDNLTAQEIQTLSDNGYFQIQELQSIDSYTFTRVVDGTLVDIVSQETQLTLTYPDVPLNDGTFLTIGMNDIPTTQTDDVTLRSSLDIEITAFDPACSGGSKTVCPVGVWGGEFHYSSSFGKIRGSGLPGNDYAATAYGEIVTLQNDGSAAGTLAQAPASWSVSEDGLLELTYADGWTQTLQILDSAGIEYGIFSEYSNGVERYAGYSVFSRSDAQVAFTAQNVPTQAGRYYNGEVNTWIPGSIDENGNRIADRRFGWVFNSDGSGSNRNWFRWGCDGNPGNELVLSIGDTTWVLNAGNVEIDRWWWNPGQRIRTWYPAATTTIDGDKVFYVLETEVLPDNSAGGEIRPLFPPRLNIQREINQHGDQDCTW